MNARRFGCITASFYEQRDRFRDFFRRVALDGHRRQE
jgi:hypothetical protein